MAFKFVNKNDPAFEEQQRQAWQKMRQRGKAVFVLQRGVLVWGGLMFLFFACLNTFAMYITNHMDHLPGLLWFNAIIWSFGGLFWGLWIWRKFERRYPTQAPSASDKNVD